MISRAQMFNCFGMPVDEVDTDSVTRVWGMNEIGEGFSKIAWNNSKLREELVRFKNFVVFTGEDVDPWVGVIYPDRNWAIEGPTISALSAEFMLTMRSPDDVDPAKNLMKTSELIKGSTGSLVKQILVNANKEEDTLLRPGQIWEGGISREQTLKGNNYWTHLKEILTRSGCEIELVPAIADNRLLIYVNVYERRGQDKSNQITLEEDRNIEAVEGMPLLVESGQLSNKMVGTGDGSTEASRVAVLRMNQDSINKYGICHIKTTNFFGVKDVGTLNQNTQVAVDREGWPIVTSNVAVSDIALFKEIQLGDIVREKFYRIGFLPNGKVGYDAKVRVVGKGITDGAGKMILALGEMVGS